MTKFSLVILSRLNEFNVESASKSLSISQILDLIPEKQRKSYSTVYRHLSNVVSQGYAKCGLDDGLASTYYITENGKSFCMSQN